MRSFLLSLLCLLSGMAFSQQSHFGSWNVINTKLNITDKWSVYNELQLRSQSFYANHFYYEVKGGVGYSFNKNFTVLLGIGKYITYTDGGSFKSPVTSNETRFWQQLTMNHYMERIKFEHRYRIEQRWYSNNTYRNRFRYRLNVVVPINHKKVGPKTFYLGSFNEVFLTNKATYFERNRFFFGVGYQFSKKFSVQPGYVNQFDFRNGTGRSKHFFQLTLSTEIDGHKNPNEKIPGNVD